MRARLRNSLRRSFTEKALQQTHLQRWTLVVLGAVASHGIPPAVTLGQQIHQPGLLVEPVVNGLANPTGMTFVSPDTFLVTEQTTGRVRVVIQGVLQANPALDLPVAGGLEPGLLSIVKHPDFANNDYVYVYYTRSTADGGPRLDNRIARFTWNGTSLDAGSEFPVHALPATNSGHHGGVLAFGSDGTLFAVIGDQHANEQTVNFPTGGPREIACVVRMNQDGTVPADNPFTTPGWEYIYAYGIRNSFGIGVDPLTGRLWQSENGPTINKEEVNLLLPGTNSGWEDTFGFTFPPPPGLFVVPGSFYSQPEFEFGLTASPTSVTFVTSAVLGPGRLHDLLVAEGHFSANHHLFAFDLNAARDAFAFSASALQDLVGSSYAEMAPILFADGFGIVTDVEVGTEGFLYVLDRSAGAVFRIRPDHPTGDADADGDLDDNDYVAMYDCFSGPAPGQAPPAVCLAVADTDRDGDIDAADFLAFTAQFSGPLAN